MGDKYLNFGNVIFIGYLYNTCSEQIKWLPDESIELNSVKHSEEEIIKSSGYQTFPKFILL